MKMKEELQFRSLNLNSLEGLAINCPRCFGPSPSDNQQDVPNVHFVNEPDYIVAFDGNFQHGRHQAASHELEEINVSYPATFLEPKVVDQWKPRQQDNPTDNEMVCNFCKKSFLLLITHLEQMISGPLHNSTHCRIRFPRCSHMAWSR